MHDYSSHMAHETAVQTGEENETLWNKFNMDCIQWMQVVFIAYSYIVYVHLWTLHAPGYNGFSFLFEFSFRCKKTQIAIKTMCVCKRCTVCSVHNTASSSHSSTTCTFFMLGPICLHTCNAILYATLSASALFSTIFYFNFVPLL